MEHSQSLLNSVTLSGRSALKLIAPQCVLFWVLCVHLAGIYLFAKGSLLNRLALPDISVDAFTSLAAHKRADLLVIDALRFD
jgi:hypothetical protein